MTTSNLDRLLLTLLVITIQTVPFLAQNSFVGIPEVINFSRADYHAGTQNWSVIQQHNQVLFFANNKGLLEFDGIQWKNHYLPNRSIVRSIAKGPNGEIMVGAQDELGYFGVENNGVLKYKSLVRMIPEENRSFEDVWKIFTTNNEVFFCSKRMIFCWDGNRMQCVSPKTRFENFFEVKGDLYVREPGVGLLKLKQGSFSLVDGGGQFADKGITAMFTKEDRLLLVTEKDGLFLQNAAGFTEWETSISSFLKSNLVYCAIQLESGRYAFGTTLDGLLIASKEGDPVLHLNKESGLQNNTVLVVFQDHQQNLWLGLDNGIDFVKISAPFTRIGSNVGVEGTGYVSTIFGNHLYLGTNQGVFRARLDGKAGRLGLDQFQMLDFPRGQVWALDKIGDQLLMGLHEGAYGINNGEFYELSKLQGAWKFLALKDNSDYALEGNYDGLHLFKKNDFGKWIFVKKLEKFNESARVMEQDTDGSIWVSHAYKGLYKIELSDDLNSISEVQFFSEKDGLPENISIDVSKVKGEVVFTTSKGVYTYDWGKGRFVPYERFNKILGGARNAHRIIEDQTGNIWYSIDDEFGLLKIEDAGFLNEAKINRYSFNHIQEELVDGFEHIYAHDDKNVFIATENGFLHFNPSITDRRDLDINVLIREVVSITDKDSTLYGGNNNLDEGKIEPIVLPYSMRSLGISYSAPFFENINQVQFRYKLDGFMEDWSEWTIQTEKEFTNLPYGDYTFHVEVNNAYGVISSPASVSINILPPWYASSFAKFIYLIAGIFLVYFVYVYYKSNLERERLAIVAEQSEELERKEAKFKKEKEQSVAEIVRLRNENLKSDIKHKNSQLASATMHLVQKGEILLKIKNELNKLSKEDGTSNRKKIAKLVRMIDDDIRLDNNWNQFEVHFDQVHENFLKNLRSVYPKLTPKDQKLCAYLRMNLTTKEIAPLMNISVRGVEISRYRLRKKLELETDTNLVDFIMKF